MPLGQGNRGQKPGNRAWCFSVLRGRYLSPSRQQGPSWAHLVQNLVGAEAAAPVHPPPELEEGAGAALLLGRQKKKYVCVCMAYMYGGTVLRI